MFATTNLNVSRLNNSEYSGLFVIFLSDLGPGRDFFEKIPGARYVELSDERKVIVENGTALSLGERGLQFYASGCNQPFSLANNSVKRITNGQSGELWSFTTDGHRIWDIVIGQPNVGGRYVRLMWLIAGRYLFIWAHHEHRNKLHCRDNCDWHWRFGDYGPLELVLEKCLRYSLIKLLLTRAMDTAHANGYY